MKFRLSLALGAALLAGASSSHAAEVRDLFADSWVATDALGRALPTGSQVRAPQSEKVAAVFYYTWQQGGADVKDIPQLLRANETAPDWGAIREFHWWGEPEAGYFHASDPWVIRRNLSMLADAGVDVLFLDATNAFTYLNTVEILCQTAIEMRAQGNATPQIAFLAFARPGFTQTQLYREFYAKNRYPELWFRWQGKPLILGVPDGLMDDQSPMSDEVRNFFTWRTSWAWSNPGGWFGDGVGKWPWLDNTPQNPGLTPDGQPEQIVVETAQHPTTNKGKSYRDGQQPPLDAMSLTPDTNKGLHFAEQWKRALEVDPQLVLVTQWNEWIAQRFVAKKEDETNFLGRPIKEGETYFVDVYNAEYNRDIEPMKGGYGDNYYYQMVDGLRRFKGARPMRLASGPRNIALGGDAKQWNAVGPEFRDAIGDTAHRDFRGWVETTRLTNDSGRNDIVAAKVARDAKNLYFRVETQNVLTPPSGANWMMLFVDADSDAQTGWHGYDVRVIGSHVERFEGGAWKKAGQIKTVTRGNVLELALPREFIARRGADLTFDFKWVDGADPDDISDWFVNGDSAPNRRFNYRFVAKP